MQRRGWLEPVLAKLEKRKKLYLFLIGFAIILSLLGAGIQFLFFARSKVSWVCEGIQVDFYNDYQYMVVGNRMFECQKFSSLSEQIVLCLISETENGYRSYAVLDLISNNMYLGVGHKEKSISRDDCFLAGMGYVSSLGLCVETQARKCILSKKQ